MEGMVFFSILWVLFCYYLVPHPIVLPEELSNLQERSDVIRYIRPPGKRTEGYYFCNPDGTYEELYFDLCEYTLPKVKKKYGDKSVKVWYKNGWVYQMSYDGEVVYNLTDSNRHAKFVTFSNFNLFLSAFFMFFLLYLSTIIRIASEKEEDNTKEVDR